MIQFMSFVQVTEKNETLKNETTEWTTEKHK